MIKRLLLVLGATLAVCGIIYAGLIVIWYHAFIAGAACPSPDSSFDQVVTQRFPVGSNAHDAIAEIRLEGYREIKPGLYTQSALPLGHGCSKSYSIDLWPNNDGIIAQITGHCAIHCLP